MVVNKTLTPKVYDTHAEAEEKREEPHALSQAPLPPVPNEKGYEENTGWYPIQVVSPRQVQPALEGNDRKEDTEDKKPRQTPNHGDKNSERPCPLGDSCTAPFSKIITEYISFMLDSIASFSYNQPEEEQHETMQLMSLTFGYLMCVDQDASLLKNLGRSIHTQLVIMCIPLLFISIAAINRGEHKERFFVIGGYELTAMHVFVGSLSLLAGFLAAAAFKLARCPPWCHGAFLGVWYLTMMYTLPATNPWLKAIQDAMWNPASLARKLARKLQ